MEMGADGIDIDVQLTCDCHLIVIYGQSIDRTTRGSSKSKDFDMNTIRLFDAGSWFSAECGGV
jgi:glycerophosphoryl diester phosphodiesterase